MIVKNKIICKECDWKGMVEEALKGINPFNGSEILGCPSCKEIDSFEDVCDESNCWNIATIGTPTDSGYRRTCHLHDPEKKENASNK